MVLEGVCLLYAESEGSEGSELWNGHSCVFLVGPPVYAMHVYHVKAMIDVRRGMCLLASGGAKQDHSSTGLVPTGTDRSSGETVTDHRSTGPPVISLSQFVQPAFI